MPQELPDQMVIQAVGFGPELTAKQAIDRAQNFLSGLEVISPWRRPFVVSGTSAEHSYMPIAEDLSDFEPVVMTALSDYNDVKYLSEDDPDDFLLGINSKCYYGFRTTFSKLGRINISSDRVSVSLKTQGLASIERGKFPMLHEVITITVHSYRENEVNGLWGRQEVLMRIIDHIIGFANPIHCCVYGSVQSLKVRNLGNEDRGNYILGWLTYTKNPHFVKVLAADKRVTPHEGGGLLKLGEGVETINDDSKVTDILDIRAKLRSAGVTDWREI